MDGKYLELLKNVNRIGTWSVDINDEKIHWGEVVKQIHEVGEDYVPDLETAINFYKPVYSRNKINKIVQASFDSK